MRLVLTILSSRPNPKVKLQVLIQDHLLVAGIVLAADILARMYPYDKYQVVPGATLARIFEDYVNQETLSNRRRPVFCQKVQPGLFMKSCSSQRTWQMTGNDRQFLVRLRV